MNGSDRYRERLLTLIAVVLAVAALRATYPVSMPLMFAAVIVAALWPLKLWFDRWLPSWLSYTLTVVALFAVLAGFAGAVYLSTGQVLSTMLRQWPKLKGVYEGVQGWASRRGVPLNGAADQRRVMAFAGSLASGVYGAATYTGFIGLLVVLGLPEVPRLSGRMRSDLGRDARREAMDSVAEISKQVRLYLGTTLATSVLTGVACSAWALVTGLDLALVWGLLNFLLNFVPVIGNIVGIIPPTLYAVIQFGGLGKPALVFAGFSLIQIVISNVVYPLLQGRQLSLSPLAIIVAMAFWSWMWGIAGALIAVPLTASAVIVCDQFDRSRWIARLLSTGDAGDGPKER